MVIGLNRGRRHPSEIQIGDSIDFWRVLKADKENGVLILFATMKVPGEAWLEFKLELIEDGKWLLIQIATFRPKGIFGRLYWYFFLPIVPALFTSTSSLPNEVTVFSTAFLTALGSAASAWIAIAFPPFCSISLTTVVAVSAPFEYVRATVAPSAARRFAIAAPIPREAPVTSATLPIRALSFLLLMLE